MKKTPQNAVRMPLDFETAVSGLLAVNHSTPIKVSAKKKAPAKKKPSSRTISKCQAFEKAISNRRSRVCVKRLRPEGPVIQIA